MNFLSVLLGLDPIIHAAFITVGGVALTMFGSFIFKRLENKYAVDAQFRQAKAELFMEFMKALDDLGSSEKTKRIKRGDNLLNFLREFRRKTMFWCSPKVMEAFDKLKNYSASNVGEGNTVKWLHDTLMIYGELILVMRKDLGLSNRGLDNEKVGLSTLRNPEILVDCVKKNPLMSTDQLAEIERNWGRSGR